MWEGIQIQERFLASYENQTLNMWQDTQICKIGSIEEYVCMNVRTSYDFIYHITLTIKYKKCNCLKFAGFQMNWQGTISQTGYRCLDCGRVYQSKTACKTHRDTHKGIYRHICPYCQKGFYGKNDLQGHLVSHTGQKEFKCDVCGKEYGYKSHLSFHMKSKHEIGNTM